ncbi:MAG: hypothetical protein BIFFINMI_00559 [Phycisphaerae bacterium]|nr:hypothetical protein [Phycisphaerae bacterium]
MDHPEPAADVADYVIQHHTGHGDEHFDLMLQRGPTLRTWQIAQLPGAGGGAIEARELSDHRLAYLTYEGPVSRGRGRVAVADSGRVVWLRVGPDELEIELQGGRCAGRYVLRRSDADAAAWQLTPVKPTS